MAGFYSVPKWSRRRFRYTALDSLGSAEPSLARSAGPSFYQYRATIRGTSGLSIAKTPYRLQHAVSDLLEPLKRPDCRRNLRRSRRLELAYCCWTIADGPPANRYR